MRYVSNHTSATVFILARREFNGSSMRGRNNVTGDVGRLPGAWRSVYYNVVNEIDYIVYSFSTPIAWHTKAGLWFIPHVKYSGYSTRHQWYALKAAMTENAFHARIEADIYYTADEIMAAVNAFNNGENAIVMHTNRQHAYMTFRGIKPGDYVFSIGYNRWLSVYNVEMRRGAYNSKYWVAICNAGEGKLDTVYIGDRAERVGRLRP